MKRILLLATAAAVLCSMGAGTVIQTNEKIDWYPTLDAGIAEAKRVNKPILLLSAAPQCTGVPGIW